jgi:type III secretion YscU/HrpY family protein
MADKNDGGDKTELPTPKRLRDARKKGDVAKSKDVGAAVVITAWLLMLAFATAFVGNQILNFTQEALRLSVEQPFEQAIGTIASEFVSALLKTSAATLIPIAVIATFAEYAQIGTILTTEKLKPSLDKMNPVEGLKRMFGMEGLVELLKTLVKVILVLVITIIVIRSTFEETGALVRFTQWSPMAGNGPTAASVIFGMFHSLTIYMFGLIVFAFAFVAILDRLYSQHSFIKKMKMSRRDIRQEYKDDEGDPHVKSARREMHQEWANQNAVGSAGSAAALLVNPTHLAIAIDYDAEECPVPIIAAKGDGPLAKAMREEAEAKGVPIIRNIATARKLWARGEVNEVIPEEMFDAIAEIILWARKAKAGDGPMWHDMDEGKADILLQEAADAT